MFTFDGLSKVCKNAELFCSSRGYAGFEIDRIIASRSDATNEWIIYLKKIHLDPSYDDNGEGPILLADLATGEVTLFMKL